jgi:hypothetical protein
LSRSEVSPPGDKLERVGEEVVIDPFSEIQKSSLLRRTKFSSNVFLIRLETISLVVLGIGLSLVDEPVGKLTHDTDEFTTLITDFEFESSDSDDISDTIDSWSSVWSLRVDDDGTELVEFESVVSWLESLVVETWVNNLEFGNKVGAVVGLGRFRDVDDDSPTEGRGVLS